MLVCKSERASFITHPTVKIYIDRLFIIGCSSSSTSLSRSSRRHFNAVTVAGIKKLSSNYVRACMSSVCRVAVGVFGHMLVHLALSRWRTCAAVRRASLPAPFFTAAKRENGCLYTKLRYVALSQSYCIAIGEQRCQPVMSQTQMLASIGDTDINTWPWAMTFTPSPCASHKEFRWHFPSVELCVAIATNNLIKLQMNRFARKWNCWWAHTELLYCCRKDPLTYSYTDSFWYIYV